MNAVEFIQNLVQYKAYAYALKRFCICVSTVRLLVLKGLSA